MKVDKCQPRVTVIIINYNGRQYLEELLSSLRDQTYTSFEAVLIDNASSDGSVDFVKDFAPWVRPAPQKTNLGFAKAANRGAQVSDAEYVVFLNTDLKLAPEWLERMVEVADQDEQVAAVAPKMLLFREPFRLNGVGGCMNALGYTWDRGMFERDTGQYDEPSDVLFASAAAALFRRATFLETGGFDERFFMYHEDVDLGWRLWLSGYRIVTQPQSVVYHHFGATTASAKGMNWREILGERNNIRALIKNYRPSNLIWALWNLFLLRQPIPRKLSQFRNFAWNLWHLPESLRLRRQVQRKRVRSDGDLKALIVQSKDVPIRL
ncbi:MAG TPA: glycosyltransferase family 2 protein [Acidobacteriota bacterium]|nr:glycosyltransferase family 2 protein [Acidobacteriota bacterium]